MLNERMMERMAELVRAGFTKEEIMRMCSETPEVANAVATGTPKAKPVDPKKQVIFHAEFGVKKTGKTLVIDKFIGKGLMAKALRKANTMALKKGYSTVSGCKTGWEFEDEKECNHALKNFNFIHNLTVEMYLEYLKGESDAYMKQAEYFDEELAKAQEQYGVK